jgi:RloB-like protein
VSQKRGGKPKRRTSGAARRRSILVFTEGLKTEPIYLTHWHRIFRERIIVTVDEFHGTPLKLVEAAAARRTADLRAARRGRGDAYSDYWCVFDIDEHPHVDRALELAAASRISVAVSNPCIELWFILHFQDQTAVIDRGDAQRKSSDLLKFGKTPTTAALADLVSRYEDARRRAKALDEKHRLDGAPQRSNPSSGAWCLIGQIRQPGR